MSAAQFYMPFRPARDDSGASLPGALAWFTLTGTNTEEDIFSDIGLTTPRLNPVEANGVGRFPNTYLDDTKTYRVRIYGPNATVGVDTPIEEYDPYIPGAMVGADDGLRADLEAVGGAARVGTSEGQTLETVALRPRRLSFRRLKERAYSRQRALAMTRDLSAMKGWAKVAGTTGGATKPVFWVTWSSDDPNTPGTLRYAVNQATALGGATIIVDPRGEIDVVLTSRLNIPSNTTLAAPGRNLKLRAKSNTQLIQITGTNVILRYLPLSHLIDTTGINNKEPYNYETLTLSGDAVTMVGGTHNAGSPGTTELVELTPETGTTDTLQNLNAGVNGQKVAIRPIAEGYTINVVNTGNINTTATLVGRSQYLLLTYSTGTSKWTVTGDFNTVNSGTSISGELDAGGYATQADGITIVPTTADKIWIDECSFQHLSDGALDVATSGLHAGGGANCRYSVSHCKFRDQYKTALSGTTSTTAGDVDYTAARQVFGSYYNNWYDHTAERHPRVSGLAYVDSVNNIFDLAEIEADDGTMSGSYGIASLYGGWVRTRGDLFRSLDGQATEAVQCSTGASGIAESAAINESSVAEGGLTIATRNTATPSALPASNYDLTPDAVPAAGTARDDWRNAICAAAGAEAEAYPRGNWYYDSTSTLAINGNSVRAAPDHSLTGRYLLADPQNEQIPTPEALNGASTAPIWVRGSTKTIASDAITVDATAAAYALNPESGSADNLATITGATDGQIMVLRPASVSHVITVLATGNIALNSYGSSIILNGSKDELTLRYDASVAFWTVLAAPPQSGTYTPTATGVVNVASTGAITGRWSKNGNIVTVTGNVSVTPTAAAPTDTQLTVSLPIASNIAAATDIDGTCATDDAAVPVSGNVKGSAASDAALLRYRAATTSARVVSFIFQYPVL